MKLSVFVATCLAQSPDLENDFGIGRAVLTPEDALKQYTEMNRGQINRLLRGDFDIMDFKLSESNSGFFLTQTKSKHMDLFFNYDKSDLESADAYAYGIVEYHGCGADSHGERFNITDGYVTANGDWQFYKRYVGDGPYGWTHAWRYFGNIIGQVWNGGIQYASANEMEKPLTQAFFYPVEDNSYTCDPYESPNPYGGDDNDDVTETDDDVTDNDNESGYSDNGSDNNGPTPEHVYPVSEYDQNDDDTTLAPYTTEPADTTTTVTTTTTDYTSTTTTMETTVSTTFSTIIFTTDGGYAVPTVTPTIIIEPTYESTWRPTEEPTATSTYAPETPESTYSPETESTYSPETEPTYAPDTEPTYSPETEPTNPPETETTYSPETEHTYTPETEATYAPETEPTSPPETEPTYSPETEPTYSPETEPTNPPETEPTYSPETEPTNPPETEPTYAPETEPTFSPETEPTNPPETEPTYSPETEPTAPPPEPTNPYNGGDDQGSNDGYGFMTDGDDSGNGGNGGYDYGFFDDDSDENSDNSENSENSGNSDFDAPHKTNSELVDTCATRLSQLKGIYGSTMNDIRSQRQLQNRFMLLESVLQNVLSENHKNRDRQGLSAITSVPRISKNADLRSVYIRCFKNFIPKIFTNFRHGGNHLVKRSTKIFKRVCQVTKDPKDEKFCNRLK